MGQTRISYYFGGRTVTGVNLKSCPSFLIISMIVVLNGWLFGIFLASKNQKMRFSMKTRLKIKSNP